MTATLSVLEALAVTAELTNTPISPIAAKVMAADLAGYPEYQVLGALTRCRKELKGRLTIADVISRLDDGRPGPEEAWAMLPHNEAKTIAWTEEMAGAWGVAQGLQDDRVAARMAFLETYRSRVQKARDAQVPVKWSVSFGWGGHYEDRLQEIRALVHIGKITASRALELGYDIDAEGAPLRLNDISARLKGPE
jgi:hypothetical protein